MLDLKEIRKNLSEIASKLQKKHYNLDTELFQKLEQQRRILQTNTEDLQNQRKLGSKDFGKLKAKGEDTSELKLKLDSLNLELAEHEKQLNKLQQDINNMMLDIPNIPDDSVPDGKDETDNKLIKTWGDIPKFDFTVQDHTAIGKNLGLDFESAAKISGSRFAILRNNLAKLHRALGQFMLDTQINNGYEEINTPCLVHDTALLGTGQLPKFAHDLFKTECKKDDNSNNAMYLIPTAEVTLTNLVRDTIVDATQLPIKLAALTNCFRSEAGSYGKDTKGLIRQHQFEKVELVQIVHPENSKQALEQMLGHAESILQALQLPYRVVELCGGDLGFSATKTYDIEVWLPAQNCYREISSISNCMDFQARRLKARFRNQSNKLELLHTLNGSGLAVGRCLVAILENYQQSDGSITIPKALQPYMNGNTIHVVDENARFQG
jgi:seryl-tRNA synthetase